MATLDKIAALRKTWKMEPAGQDKTDDGTTQEQPDMISFLHNSPEMIEIGRSFPPEFLESLGESLTNLVWEWMKANGVPANIIEAMELGQGSIQSAAWLRAGNLVDLLAAELVIDVPRAVRLIWDLGGTYYNSNGEKVIRPAAEE